MSGQFVASAMTPEWFSERNSGIGASECAIAAGLSPYQTPLELYLRKRGKLSQIEDSDAMRMGRLLEPVVKAEFCRLQECELINANPGLYRHAQFTPILATPDGIVDESTLLECKTASWRMKSDWGEQDTDMVPDHYLCQCQQQMAVMGAELVHLAVLFDGALLKRFRVMRNENLITLLIAANLELWDRIQTGRAPEPTWGHDSTPKLIRQIHHSINDVRVELSPESCAARRRYDEIANEMKQLEKEQKACRARYESEIGENFAGVLGDGRMIRRSLIKGGPVQFTREDKWDYRAVKYDGGEILTLEQQGATV